jgi:Uncharacterized protein conserved in bacteria
MKKLLVIILLFDAFIVAVLNYAISVNNHKKYIDAIKQQNLVISSISIELDRVEYLCIKLQKDNEELKNKLETFKEEQIQKDISIAKDKNIANETKIETKTKAKTETNTNMTGLYTITYYCPCEKCCGKTDGVTASGTQASAGRTVAADGRFAFGTKIYIDGIGERVVEDRGGSIKGNRIDVFVDNHEKALELGKHTAQVSIVQ